MMRSVNEVIRPVTYSLIWQHRYEGEKSATENVIRLQNSLESFGCPYRFFFVKQFFPLRSENKCLEFRVTLWYQIWFESWPQCKRVELKGERGKSA